MADDNIRKFARAIVEPDAQAVFMSQGKVMASASGQHTLDASELPFLGMFIDWASAGNAFKCELYFVGRASTRNALRRPTGRHPDPCPPDRHHARFR